MFNFRDHGDDISYCGQISVAQVAEFAAQGFGSILCNRPDAEPGAVPSADIEQAARAHGMAFAYQPVEFSTLGRDDGVAFAKLVDALPKPILAYCRTGRRCAALWVLARAPLMGVEAALTASRECGCELEDLRPRLVSGGGEN